MRAVMFGLAVSLSLASPASADYLMTGEELYGACTNSAEMQVCLAYVSGVADEISHMNELVNVFEQVQNPDAAPVRCIRARLPDELSAETARDVFLRRVEGKPAVLRLPAAELVSMALGRAYPCPAKP